MFKTKKYFNLINPIITGFLVFVLSFALIGIQNVNAVATITIADDTINEAAETGELITVTLAGDTFVETLTQENWAVTNLPTGVTKGTVIKVDATHATIALSGNRTVDYDSDITNVTVTIQAAELYSSSSEVSTNTGVTIVANNDAETVTAAWATPPGTNGVEATMNDEILTVTLAGGTLIEVQVSTSTITATGTATTEAGVSIESVTYVNATSFNVALAWDSTDYDVNKTLTINVAAAAYDEGAGAITDDITLTATVEPPEVTIADDGAIAEAAEDTEVITVTLTGDTFIAELVPGNWVVTNLPTGVTAGAPSRSSSTQATITLSGNRTADYDSDITNVTVTIEGNEFTLYASQIIVSTGVTLTATNDAESISIASDGSISEAAENGEVITVTLTGGTFANPLVSENWVITNLPTGVTAGALSRSSSTQATITLSGNRTVDYDSDITNLTVTVAAADVDDSSVEVSDNTGVTFTATNDAESISIASDGSISEAAENGEVITVTLTGGTFANPLVSENWVITNLPTGVTAGALSRSSSTQATITLSGNRTVDYDSNITNLTVTVAAADVDDSSVEVSDNTGVTFTATNDAETVTAAWATPPGTNGVEATMNDEILTVTLAGGTLIEAQVSTSTITATGTATTEAGVSIESVTYVNATSFNVALAWDSTDYDVNKTLTINVAAAAYDEGAGAITDDITLTATVEEPLVTIASDGEILEAAEAGEVITITLVGDTFANPLTSTNWVVTNLPTGVATGTVSRISDTTATITLSGNRTVDYDSNITNLTVTIEAAEFVTHGSQVVVSTGVTFTATNDAETVTAAWATPPGTNGVEATMNDEILTVTLAGGTLIEAQVSTSTITATGTATTEAGISIESVTYVNATSFNVALAWDSTDYDVNKTLTINVAAAAYDEGVGAITDDITLTATDEVAAITIASDGEILEAAEDTEVITITLTEDTFANPLTSTNWVVTNLPTGVATGTVSRISDTTATITLSGNRTVDYDSNITNLTVTVQGAEFVTHANEASASTGVTFTATNDAESISIASDGSISEAAENGEVITVTLTGGTFANPLVSENWVITNLPTGVTAGALSRSSSTQATITLSGNRTVDYDSDITNLTVTVAAADVDDSSVEVSDNTGVTFTATDEPAAITIASDGEILEAAEDTEVITITLTEDTFVGSLTSTNWVVTNLPTGVATGTVSRISDTTATITLSGNRTVDYDSNITNLTVTVQGAEFVTHANEASANTGVIFTATNDAESITDAWKTPPGTGGAEATMDNEILTITLVGGTLIEAQVTTSTITATGTATTEAGISIESVTYVNATSFNVALAWDSTDYDVNKTLTINVAAAAYDEGVGAITDDITLTATDEPAAITIASDGEILEAAEDTEVITITLTEDTFVGSLTSTNWVVTNLPTGVATGTVSRISDTTATITLSGNRTVDYDSNITNLTVTVQGAEFVTHANEASANTGVIFTATNDAESITDAWKTPPGTGGTEATMDNEILTITLVGGTLIEAQVSTSTITATGTATTEAGISIESVTYVNATSFNVALAWDSTDYDVNKTLTINVAAAAYDEGAGAITDDITLTATDEPTVTIVASDVAIYDGDVGTDVFTIEATFTKTMATGTIPTVVFNPVLDTTLTNPTGVWSVSDTVYTWTYDIADAGVEVADVDVTVDGGKDENDVDQEPGTETDHIDVDTQNPTVTLTYTRTSNDSDVSGNVFPAEGIRITATFSEAVDENTVPTIAVDTPSDDLSASNMTKTLGTVWYYNWTVPANTNPDAQGVATSTIVATDLASNANTSATNNTLTIDNLSPIASITAESTTATSTILTVVTNESATCAYATDDIAYASMTQMESTGGTTHTQAISGLSGSTYYDYYIRCADASNNTMTNSVRVGFTTLGSDSTPPGISGAVPADTALNVAIDAVMTITFDEPLANVDNSTVKLYIDADDNNAVSAGDTEVPSIVSLTNSGSSTTITITSLSYLSNSGNYIYRISTGVTDVAGNPLAGNADYNFTTVAPTPPTIESRYPVNGATGIAIGVQPYIKFSHAMNVSTVNSANINLCSDAECNTKIDTFVSPDEGDTTAIIKPNSSLSYGTDYWIRVTTNVLDLAGNAYTPATTTVFTTAAEGVGTLSIDNVSITKSVAHANGEWSGGWTFDIEATIPNNIASGIKMIFDDWKQSGATAIAVANNIRFSVGDGDNVTITAAANAAWDNWLPVGWLDISGVSDNDDSKDGKQITIQVETKIPDTVTLGGSYSAAFALNAE